MQTPDGLRFRSALTPHEAALLKSLVGSVLGMLDERESSTPQDELEQITGMRTGNTERPEDATLRRLLPDFHAAGDAPGEAEAVNGLNAALRSLHEPEIIDAKRAAAESVLASVPDDGGRFELTEEGANAWISAVNDVRLALGTLLEITPNGPDQLPDDDPLAPHLDVYQWLTVLQEYLVLALMGHR